VIHSRATRGRLGTLWILAAVVALGAFFALRAWVPSADPGRSICALRRGFGLACPTCGMTRAFAELAKGHWSAAGRLHPLASPLAFELGLVWALAGVTIVRPAWPLPRRAVLMTALATMTALFVVWIYRIVAGTLPP